MSKLQAPSTALRINQRGRVTSKYPTNHDAAEHMQKRKAQNRAASRSNAAENWMAGLLLEFSSLKWSRQIIWGFRVFDFWNASKGVCIEVDGDEHGGTRDIENDATNWLISGIIVLRVKRFDEAAAKEAIRIASAVDDHADRRLSIGIVIEPGSTKKRRPRAQVEIGDYLRLAGIQGWENLVSFRDVQVTHLDKPAKE